MIHINVLDLGSLQNIQEAQQICIEYMYILYVHALALCDESGLHNEMRNDW